MSAKTGYQGFGSFHSDDVEVLIRQDAASYLPPSLPFCEPAADPSSSITSESFGDAAKRHFLIDFDGWTFLNHGAFGAVSKTAYNCADQWRRHCELQPLNFIDRQLFPQLVRVIREMAAFVNCTPQDLVLLPNATTGLNAVISSCKLHPGDVIYSLNIGYGSVKKMIQAVCETSGAQHVVGEVMFPISGPEDIMSVVEQSLPDGAKLAVFDAVTSNTALVLPLQELIAVCRSRGVPVLIDGAHALGMLPIDLQQLQPDYFVSNCHKWLCGARGSAMLYVAPQWQQQVQPPVLSHGAQAGVLSRFIWDGCRDYAPLLAISTAVKWWKRLGANPDTVATDDSSQVSSTGAGLLAQPSAAVDSVIAASSKEAAEPASAASSTRHVSSSCNLWCGSAHPGDGGGAARQYMHQLLRSAADMLVQRWGTGCLGPSVMTAAMVLVQLPCGGELPEPGRATSADAKHIQDTLHSQHQIEVPIKNIQDTLYVRISAHIYNIMSEYTKLAEAIESMCRDTVEQ